MGASRFIEVPRISIDEALQPLFDPPPPMNIPDRLELDVSDPQSVISSGASLGVLRKIDRANANSHAAFRH